MIHVTVADTDMSYGFYVVPEDGNISYQASYDNLVSGNQNHSANPFILINTDLRLIKVFQRVARIHARIWIQISHDRPPTCKDLDVRMVVSRT